MRNYLDDYRTLGVTAGCTLRTLQTARRRLIKSWHPDRFPADSDSRQDAEVRLKDINTAFDRLVEYHHRFGSLPTTPTGDVPQVSLTQGTKQTSAPSPPIGTPTSSERPATHTNPRRSNRVLRWAIALATIVFVAEAARLALQLPEDDSIVVNQQQRSTSEPASLPPTSAYKQASVPYSEMPNFTIGSTLGEVYAIQGIPTATEQHVWYYGKSKIYFTYGAVTSWDEDPANPLKATLVTPVTKQNSLIFSLGSTKAEVRAAQGKPLVETESLWDYGLAKVYFRDGRVIGWDTSPMGPLRARK